jgi:hypothetical protein
MRINDSFREKLKPTDMSFIILNHLNNFDNKPDCIKAIDIRMKKLFNNAIHSHAGFYEKALEHFESHGKFPDMQWLKMVLPEKMVKEQLGNYSITIYEDFMKTLDWFVIQDKAEKALIDPSSPDKDNCQELIKDLAKHLDVNLNDIKIDKPFLLGMYSNYSKEYKGIKSYINQIDDVIGSLGYKSMSVLGAPSGHGKSTISMAIMYNTCVFGGNCVDFVSFEMPKEHIWFAMVSIESYHLGYNIPFSSIKFSELDEKQEEQYDICMESLLNKLNKSGGFINVMDLTTMSADTFEGFCSRLESTAEERGRPADLIVVDNVDGFKGFKGQERDTSTRVNNMIISLDSYSKSYSNGTGTSILILTQLNRDGIKKLISGAKTSNSSEGGTKKEPYKPDFTVFKEFSSLYERGTLCVVLFADEKMRGMNKLELYPVKNRNKAVPEEPLKIFADYAFNIVGGKPVMDAGFVEGDLADTIFNEESDEDFVS